MLHYIAYILKCMMVLAVLGISIYCLLGTRVAAQPPLEAKPTAIASALNYLHDGVFASDPSDPYSLFGFLRRTVPISQFAASKLSDTQKGAIGIWTAPIHGILERVKGSVASEISATWHGWKSLASESDKMAMKHAWVVIKENSQFERELKEALEKLCGELDTDGGAYLMHLHRALHMLILAFVDTAAGVTSPLDSTTVWQSARMFAQCAEGILVNFLSINRSRYQGMFANACRMYIMRVYFVLCAAYKRIPEPCRRQFDLLFSDSGKMVEHFVRCCAMSFKLVATTLVECLKSGDSVMQLSNYAAFPSAEIKPRFQAICRVWEDRSLKLDPGAYEILDDLRDTIMSSVDEVMLDKTVEEHIATAYGFVTLKKPMDKILSSINNLCTAHANTKVDAVLVKAMCAFYRTLDTEYHADTDKQILTESRTFLAMFLENFKNPEALSGIFQRGLAHVSLLDLAPMIEEIAALQLSLQRHLVRELALQSQRHGGRR